MEMNETTVIYWDITTSRLWIDVLHGENRRSFVFQICRTLHMYIILMFYGKLWDATVYFNQTYVALPVCIFSL